MSGSVSGAEPAVSATAERPRPGAAFYLVFISAVVLFTAEIWISVLGVLWALAGFLSLGPAGTAIVAVLIVPGAAFVTWKLAVMALESERDLLVPPLEDA
ncbi:hypothetical protein [Stappia stellulata]|uniref:hypothetical protein n=1 Tax=Stappia stellulata TaxID=71235 RepID=UPI001AD8F265|nr:hypothetical protein [Stappia stellulata]